MVRRHFDTLEDFSAVAISQLVKYLDAKLGMLYIKNDAEEEQVMLDLKGCYAYDRNKYLENSIEPGFGYPGQVFLEKETVYLTDLPHDYIKIGSSLGETPPRSLIVVPMVANGIIEGVLEIASLQKYEQYQITFVEKVAEIFATHIVNVRINEKTNRLLEESKKQTEEMKAQEEELRQNMEEMEALHEQMRRDQAEETKNT
jgi:GAF domain-containing protein